MVFSRTEHTPLLDGDGARAPDPTPDSIFSHAVARRRPIRSPPTSSPRAFPRHRARRARHRRDHLSRTIRWASAALVGCLGVLAVVSAGAPAVLGAPLGQSSLSAGLAKAEADRRTAAATAGERAVLAQRPRCPRDGRRCLRRGERRG